MDIIKNNYKMLESDQGAVSSYLNEQMEDSWKLNVFKV